MAFEKLKKSKKINTTKNPTTDATEAQKSKDKNKNASVSNTKKNEKPKVEENKEQSAPLKLEKKPTKEKKENGLSNINKPQPSILESGDVSADKACCKQCRIF